ncbi:MAG: carbonic anhydrase [Proteobacteria bacterium]|nr:MAG: carbonic anhydrase [Pseudomonadota bacterium]
MNAVIGRIVDFEKNVFARHADLYGRLASKGQSPKSLMISCADSRIVPELILQADPGELFVTRNAGNIVPPFAQANGGVSSAVEYAVVALGVTDIIVCGHSGCGAMGALLKPGSLDEMPNVAAWLRHSHAAQGVVHNCYPNLPDEEKQRVLALENVVCQLAHLRTHPSVAAGIARGTLALHGWFVDIHAGSILALDEATGRFKPVTSDQPIPVALPHAKRLAAAELP